MTEIVKLYLELGIFGLIAVVFVWQSIASRKSSDKKFDTLFSILIKTKTVHTEEEDVKASKMETKIDDILCHLLSSTNADRAYLVRYHNGGKDLTGNSFLKMSMSNEKLGIGIDGMQKDFKDQFRSSFSWLVRKLEVDTIVNVSDCNGMQDIDTNMYQFLKTRKIVGFHCIAVKSDSGTIIGYVAVEYMVCRNIDTERIESCLNDKRLKIETLLSIR